MGLDILYAADLKRVAVDDGDEAIDAAYEAGLLHVYANPCFPDQADGLETGFYRGQGRGDFRAGSYDGYNAFRGALCKAALGVDPHEVWSNPTEFADRPFYEMIHFSDCEGVIGPKTSAMLAADFVIHRDRVRPVFEGVSEWWGELYGSWATAYATASQNGAVMFA